MDRGAATTTLDALFPTLGAARFLDVHWPHTPAVVHGALERLPGLTGIPELGDVEALCRAHSGPVKAGTSRPDGRWRETPVSSAQGALLYESGLALCLAAVDASLPPLRRFVLDVARDLAVPDDRAHCNAYASRAGGGTAMHFDGQDVIVIHLRGAKRWRYAPNEHVRWPLDNFRRTGGPAYFGAFDLPATMPDDAVEVVMRPGAVLALPRGFWHETETLEDALSLTLTFRTPTWVEVVADGLASVLRERTAWREPIAPPRSEGDRRRLQGRVTSLLAELTAPDTPLDAERLLERAGLAEGQASPARFTRNPSVRCGLAAVEGGDAAGAWKLVAEGPSEVFEIELAPGFEPLVRWVLERDGDAPFSTEQALAAVGGLSRPLALAALAALEQAGALRRSP